jgi:hypothetical protein
MLSQEKFATVVPETQTLSPTFVGRVVYCHLAATAFKIRASLVMVQVKMLNAMATAVWLSAAMVL